MEQDEREALPDALYDFLYRDSSRIASYYAQIFTGLLTTLEETESERDTTDKGAKLNLQLASGDVKSGQENMRSQKRIIDPHDVLTTDVLSSLRSAGKFSEDVLGAPQGALIVAQGTLVLVDRGMLQLAVVALEAEASNKMKTAKTPAQRAEAQVLKQQIIPFLSKIDLPSGFVLQTTEGLDIAGTLKDDGMEEPISTYYFKHGAAGLSSVYLIGIKETATYSFALPSEQIIGAGQVAAEALRNMMFPPGAVMVTPIALFREI
jgi:hypothetical protein